MSCVEVGAVLHVSEESLMFLGLNVRFSYVRGGQLSQFIYTKWRVTSVTELCQA